MVGLVCLKSNLKSAEREDCRTIYSSGWLGTQSGIRYLIQDDDDEELRKETQESSKNQGHAGMDGSMEVVVVRSNYISAASDSHR